MQLTFAKVVLLVDGHLASQLVLNSLAVTLFRLDAEDAGVYWQLDEVQVHDTDGEGIVVYH